jgi:hypothetical protein
MIAVMGLACVDDLNTVPLDKDIKTANVVYEDTNSYKQVLAKLYAGLAVTGQQGPAGLPILKVLMKASANISGCIGITRN